VEVEILVYREAIVERGLLEHNAQAAPCLQGLGDDIDAADARGSAVGPEDGAENVEQGRLAGAVRSEQREQLVAADREAHIVQRERAPVTFAHALDLDLR